jgi:Pyruvate-formate lyase-activating enzyme
MVKKLRDGDFNGAAEYLRDVHWSFLFRSVIYGILFCLKDEHSRKIRSVGKLERGLIFDIKRYAIHDGPGIRTTVHLKGCPLSCWWCHNPESQSMLPELLYKPERCIGCGACVDACEQGAVSATAEGYPTDSLKCTGSGACADVCPADARELCGRSMSVSELMKDLKRSSFL